LLLALPGPPNQRSFVRDGLLLLHKEAQYCPGQTPLALLWKDRSSSRYFIDTDAAGAWYCMVLHDLSELPGTAWGGVMMN
jgi:hypothetical protein